ncbi:hypothetical protein I7I51_02499 [Histoplasma capsulatum]|uniref:Uncharacterized protein n=1 Tax=Ajellomyces capsulatus TaxID=5037 RepID=A0A8A1M9Z3_AJECA|nr:hypothetical protein I7I51_02499 [Histoplasma capsulatum]
MRKTGLAIVPEHHASIVAVIGFCETRAYERDDLYSTSKSVTEAQLEKRGNLTQFRCDRELQREPSASFRSAGQDRSATSDPRSRFQGWRSMTGRWHPQNQPQRSQLCHGLICATAAVACLVSQWPAGISRNIMDSFMLGPRQEQDRLRLPAFQGLTQQQKFRRHFHPLGALSSLGELLAKFTSPNTL